MGCTGEWVSGLMRLLTLPGVLIERVGPQESASLEDSVTVIDRPDRSALPLACTWLALGVPIGGMIGWLAQMSDRAADREFGTFLLVLSLLSLVLGVGLLASSRTGLLVASLLLSAAWVGAAAIVFVVADFTTDKLWGVGLTGLVAFATLSVAAFGRQRHVGPQGGGLRR